MNFEPQHTNTHSLTVQTEGHQANSVNRQRIGQTVGHFINLAGNTLSLFLHHRAQKLVFEIQRQSAHQHNSAFGSFPDRF